MGMGRVILRLFVHIRRTVPPREHRFQRFELNLEGAEGAAGEGGVEKFSVGVI